MDVEKALMQFDHKVPNAEHTAKYVGFSKDELDMLGLFWEPASNGSETSI